MRLLSLSNVRVESGVLGTLSIESFLCGGNGTCCSWIGESCFGRTCPLRTDDGSLSASELSDAYDIASTASRNEFEFECVFEWLCECECELCLPSEDGRCGWCAEGTETEAEADACDGESSSEGEDADRFMLMGCAPHPLPPPGVVGVVRARLLPLPTDFVGLS